ncbi:MAG: hypothetical protein KME50_36745 [Nostoc desertorum CM1-VF14]|nr:hypothetical protein [Nostoc desertorum CM1-VF14]
MRDAPTPLMVDGQQSTVFRIIPSSFWGEMTLTIIISSHDVASWLFLIV